MAVEVAIIEVSQDDHLDVFVQQNEDGIVDNCYQDSICQTLSSCVGVPRVAIDDLSARLRVLISGKSNFL